MTQEKPKEFWIKINASWPGESRYRVSTTESPTAKYHVIETYALHQQIEKSNAEFIKLDIENKKLIAEYDKLEYSHDQFVSENNELEIKIKSQRALIEKLEKENAELDEIICAHANDIDNILEPKVIELTKQNAKLVEALKGLANAVGDYEKSMNETGGAGPALISNMYHIARKTLAEMGLG